MQESNEGSIVLGCAPDGTDNVDLSYDDPKIVRLFIDFVYLSDYVTPFEQQARDIESKGEWVSRWSKSKGRKQSRWEPAPPPATILKDDQLATHARMFQMGDKFFVPTLKTVAVTKFEKRASAGNLDPDDLAAAITIAYATGPARINEMKNCVFGCLVEAKDRVVLNECVRATIESVENLAFNLFKCLKYGREQEQEQEQEPAEAVDTGA
jgi:hypothetical protein